MNARPITAITSLIMSVLLLTGAGLRAESIADSAFAAYNAAFLVKSGGQTFYKKGTNNNAYAGTWVQGSEIQLAEDAYDADRTEEHKKLVNDLVTTFLAKENYDWSKDSWNDDIAWMVIACVRGYQITGKTAFLNKATAEWNKAFNRGWDTALGGGVWEDMNSKFSKCALSNDPMIVPGCALYQITRDAGYLTKCRAMYTWVHDNLFNTTTGQVIEAIATNGKQVSDNVYNSGSFINAANCLHNVTKEVGYYNDAMLAADHVVHNNRILSHGDRGENSWGDQFVRGLSYFCRDNNLWGRYSSWLKANATAAWNNRRPDLNITWNAWNTPTPEDNCTSLECLSAAVVQQVIVQSSGSRFNDNGDFSVFH